MEFHFNINALFKIGVSKIENNLVPCDFSGAMRFSGDVAAQVGEIIDEMGIASAKAQQLHHPITSGKKLRESEHTLYLITDAKDNDAKGCVGGLLKVGFKNLFLSDEAGKTHELKTLCVLDFYVHESRQRCGYGKMLYDYMLNDNKIEPCKYAFDKPTVNLLMFLKKHYGLQKLHPQNNNFVMFEGFFDETKPAEDKEYYDHHHFSPKTNSRNGLDESVQSNQYLPHLYGRGTAFKLPDSMAGIMWQNSPEKVPTVTTQESEVEPTQETSSEELVQNGRHTAFKLADHMFE